MEATVAKIKKDHEAAMTKAAKDYMAAVFDGMSWWIVRQNEAKAAQSLFCFLPRKPWCPLTNAKGEALFLNNLI